MADTIGVKIGVDGEREFKQALSNINTQMRVLGSEMKLVDSQFANQDKSVQALTARNTALQKSIEGQKSKIELLEKALKNSASSFGENDKRTLAWKQKLNEAKAELNKMERQVDENNKSLEQAKKDFDNAGDEAEEYGKKVKDSGDKSKSAGEALSGLGTACKAVGVAIAAAAAAVSAAAIAAGKALIQMTKEGAEYADSVITESQVTGIATDKLQEYYYAAELVDVSVETLTGSMAKNIKSMKSAADGSAAYAEAYDKLGVSVTNADGTLRDSDEVYWELIDALGQVENETERDALAMQVLGRSAQDLNPLILAGSDRMAELGEEARKAGYVLSDDLLSAYGAYDDAMQRFTNGTKAAKNALGTVLLPILTDLSNEGVNLLGEFSNAVLECGGDITKMAEIIDEMLPEVVGIFSKYIPVILSLIGSVLKSIGSALISNLPMIVDTITEILTQLLGALVAALPEITSVLFGMIKTIIGAIISNLPLLLDAVSEVVKSVLDALSNSSGGFTEAVSTIFTQLADKIVELVPVVLDAVVTLVGNFMQNYESTLSLIINKTIDIIEKVVGAILAKLPDFINAALSIVKSIVSSLLGALPQLIAAIGRMIPQIVKTILSCIPSIIEAVIDIVNAIIDALPEILTSIIGMLDEILAGVLSAIFAALPSIVTAVLGLVLGIVDALPEIITMVVSMIPEIITSLINTLIDSIPELVSCVMEVVQGILEHLPEIIMSLVAAIPEIISAIIQALIEGIPQIFEVGVNFVKGLWEGIKSMITWLWNKISDWCSGLWNGIKDFFGIHSPSTKFAEIGENMGLGLGIGFVDTMKSVENDIENAIPTDFDIDANAHLKSVAYDNNNETSRIGNAVSAAMETVRNTQVENDAYKEQITLLRQQNTLLKQLVEKELSVVIGDDEIGRANSRYEEKRGLSVNEGGFKNAY